MKAERAPAAWWEIDTGEREPVRLDVEYVKDELRKKMWSQSDLVVHSGVSKQMISDLLTLRRAPSPKTVRALAEALDVLPRKLILDARSAQQSASVRPPSEAMPA